MICDDCGNTSGTYRQNITSGRSPYGAYLCNDCYEQALIDNKVDEKACARTHQKEERQCGPNAQIARKDIP